MADEYRLTTHRSNVGSAKTDGAEIAYVLPMAYDEALAERIRDHFQDDPDIVEKKMFGGVAYMFQGNMAVGIHDDGLMVRLGDDAPEALSEPGVGPMNIGSKQMRGWVVVGADAIAEQAVLAAWIERGLDYAGSLPAK